MIVERLGLGPDDRFPDADGSVADVLLAVHRSYLGVLGPVVGEVHAMAHITGGGLPGNLNRALPATLDAVVNTATWDVPQVFRVLQEAGAVSLEEMFRAFNMGVGMVVIADAAGATRVRESAAASGMAAWVMGEVVSGTGKVIL
jgi:phosphoribosylformylglycinamidine cyclo-ligase